MVIRTDVSRLRRSICCRLAAVLLCFAQPALAVVEMTPWGAFNFPPPVRHQREAQAMFAEAKAPIVVAIRFLAATDSRDAPWINHHLACGSNETVRPDLAQAMVRASTLMAYQLMVDLERGRTAAAEMRAGRPVDRPVRYAGPVTIVLEPVRISVEGEALPPPVAVEPHLRVFFVRVRPTLRERRHWCFRTGRRIARRLPGCGFACAGTGLAHLFCQRTRAASGHGDRERTD